ncbi:myosin-8-like [Dorcoceras hygrometricum]|uniref:Myosin-8-like n=1 Tax=Dorcoceras hygrometricum TaxID=472368 RepID=A0A2Z7AKL5_9LAMI|nr:myosin-8-like [Dorcoceras hygrometricum]
MALDEDFGMVRSALEVDALESMSLHLMQCTLNLSKIKSHTLGSSPVRAGFTMSSQGLCCRLDISLKLSVSAPTHT